MMNRWALGFDIYEQRTQTLTIREDEKEEVVW